jgi:hypothetical protein
LALRGGGVAASGHGVTGGTGFADFREVRRLLPNATSNSGSSALLAELDAALKQFPTFKGSLYAFNGDVPAFYTWLQNGTPSMLTAIWRAIARTHRRP